MEEVEQPTPGAGEVLVRVRASSANPYDLVFQLGGTTSPGAIRKLMSEKGRLVQCAGDGNRVLGPVWNVVKAMATNPFVSQTLKLVNTREDTETLDALRLLIEEGSPRARSSSPVPDAAGAVRLRQLGSQRAMTLIPPGRCFSRSVASL